MTKLQIGSLEALRAEIGVNSWWANKDQPPCRMDVFAVLQGFWYLLSQLVWDKVLLWQPRKKRMSPPLALFPLEQEHGISHLYRACSDNSFPCQQQKQDLAILLFLSPVELVPVAISAHSTAASAWSHMITGRNPPHSCCHSLGCFQSLGSYESWWPNFLSSYSRLFILLARLGWLLARQGPRTTSPPLPRPSW